VIAFFVTGTDTGAGKTTAAAAVLAAAVRRGLRVAAMKPVESGCVRQQDGSLLPADAVRLREAAGAHQSLAEVCPMALEAPLAPWFAAELDHRAISLDHLAERADRLARTSPDLLLIEGAGGLLVPLSADSRVIDLIARLGHPVLVVARASLGTINHTSLTIDHCLNRHIPVRGAILVDAEGAVAASAIAQNRAAIERFTGVPVFGCLPHLPGASLGELARAAEESLDLDRLLPPAAPRRSTGAPAG
jgi:dethiobiotin synthetase